ncbi:condensin-2 complex subunit H2 isoform X2 [Eleginops maclovinus]|uniref:condensin-2 complex subunit H2 isoform X2 n=1 Tax=Eleginops maclovinus TaxID=56733 RepID=UPI00308014EF
MASTESRFAHLLQPIRELTKNWDIDVASELNDYLEELDEMCITFDGGKIRLNFAEAALVIQGSACIYSKKVELLHSLVYQTLEYINNRNKKHNKQQTASQEDGEDRDDEDVAVFNLLDVDDSENSQSEESNTTVSCTPLPPETLIPPEASEKNKLPLISVKGDLLCSQKDFRITLFVPGDEDMILLSVRSGRLLQGEELPPAEPLPPAAEAPAAEAEDIGGGDADDFLPLEDNNMDQEEHQEHVQRQQAASGGRMILRQRLEDNQLTRKEVNVWALHDPYAVFGEDKPFKSGKCYRVPEGLNDGGKRKRKPASALQDFRSWFRGTFDPLQQKMKNGPTFADLNYIYLRTMKDRLKSRKRVYRKAGVVVSDEELRRTFLQPEGAGLHQGEEPEDGVIPPDMLGGDDDLSDNEQEAFTDGAPAEFGGRADFVSPDAHRDELSYEDLVKLRVEQLVVNCRGYTQETALSRRVKDWEDKIRPELQQQEERLVFDIHDYGERIVGSLNSVGQRRTFASIVAGMDNFEACKYLLASLQLANDYTVDLDSAGGPDCELEDRLDSAGLTLLSTERANDRFKTLKSC